MTIQVIGQGLVISNWFTQAEHEAGPYICTYSAYWGSKSTIAATGNVVCGTNAVFTAYLPGVYVYNQSGYACNTWVGITGKPCLHITP